MVRMDFHGHTIVGCVVMICLGIISQRVDAGDIQVGLKVLGYGVPQLGCQTPWLSKQPPLVEGK